MNIAGERGMALCATAAGQPLYEKLGFEGVGTVTQYQGFVTALPQAADVPLTRCTGADLDWLIQTDRPMAPHDP
ncbi:hypothetical protein P775_24920 [Puniceibacterium antarcticum]|uniref:N-acetyltransferase domain-containing protein n=1 Tax=Puniceibacterium antarcticum TaxID=1206336 RepID=A0A2G8R6M3_9RHOB|nr:hypothetical protein [Puniceibacterium antarcticum]PIL17172.1 hypothetical protein P775_24920 [Puniceibacterium antarcticum]